jgi:hypothetical protein
MLQNARNKKMGMKRFFMAVKIRLFLWFTKVGKADKIRIRKEDLSKSGRQSRQNKNSKGGPFEKSSAKPTK